MNTTKVLVVYHFFPHYRKGVIEEMLKSEEAEYFFAASDTAEVIAPSIKAYIPENNYSKLIIKKVFRGLYWLSNIDNAIKDINPSVIIFLGDMNCLNAWISAIRWRIYGKRVLFWAHGWNKDNEKFLKSKIRNLFFKIPQQILLYGRRARKIAVNHGFDPKKIYVIYNSLDYYNQVEIRKNTSREAANQFLLSKFPEFDSNNGLILCSSRLTASKRFDLVIQAIANIDPSLRPALLIIGDGEEMENLRNSAGKYNVKTYFFGACYDENELSRCFLVADVLVSPGNVGLSAMHAMVYGLPVITHADRNKQMPETESVIDGKTGLLYDEGDVDSLRDAIYKMLSFPEEVKEKMRTNCVNVIDSYFNPYFQVKKINLAVSGQAEYEDVSDSLEIDFIK
ncbi:glycosyltransferase [Luteolibacter algae]|uniref:Glycosyltransferase n=1 Tax=Luteolibacter algae TaxID=454151 RepID=A0ABW5D5H4_9BACT